ncbi:hypothetical protein NDA11_004647 [Ustilago hordei]|uniref:Zn(2)-C6 fungal-type domain-containing protein n=1 Tax=Ustilago hordei TaxID=120017 RepID=I2FX69_USTHO|nr:uncharacterized protein UHO2_04337 [Ustilago hordei]KAJ1573649.1 hypothetical protein NDA15_000816 [Ustilago hordei]KAJ1579359.1 hypothetical protein NDA11_004647 [Ustilago hordei]KAJ1579773.1 hypothetical protein NDA12_006760 [Ustilago hordei]KAJ1598673.1 hypothetical protein NDA14_006722 [Ustilago hordei]CCF51512.1 uncharacterized protein UHOR_05544 [Ustilago hordei]
MPSSSHPYRSAAHQLQHPEHASYSPSPRSTPLYSTTGRTSHAYRSASNASSPEAFGDHNSKRSGHDHYPTSSSGHSAPRTSIDPPDTSPQSGTSASKRRKQSNDSPAIPASSRSPALNPKIASANTPEADTSNIDSKPSTRVAKACQPCSAKKRKCDGRQPECSVCQVLRTPCTYNHTGLKRGPPKGFRSSPKESAKAKLIRTLETTIRDLVNHLGKEDAGAQILRVSAHRELSIADTKTEKKPDPGDGAKGSRRPAMAEDRSAARIKIEHLTSTSSTSFGNARHSDSEADDPAAEAEEDVIGETRQGELVYRGSSSGIGILQRQHRAESPSAAIGIGATRSVASSSSAPFGGRSGDDRGPVDVKPPVFLPISSPRPVGDAETTSSQQDRSPRPSGLTPRKDAANLQSLYPGSSRDGRPSTGTTTEDPVVSDQETDRLFRYYWQGFHPFYPILYKPWFVTFSREELRSNLDSSLLYAIYAIAACVVPGNASAFNTASDSEPSLHKLNLDRVQSFCRAAERHVLAKGLRPDIASIQTCWLLSLYSHGTGDLSRAWNFSNLASSMAVDMGLHRWPIYRPEIVQDRVQRETRIRIIWHCYIVDKLLCAEMGRPVGLRAKDIDVPLLSEAEEDEFELWSDQTEMQHVDQGGARRATATSGSAPRRLHAPSCLNWGVHLFKIVERILDEVHSLRRKALLRKQGKEQVRTDLDGQLTEWKLKLPPHLHLDDDRTQDGPFPSFFALNLWYYTARLLLHRPFIPQEEGLSMSKVLENDSHRQSTLAANTICDLLEATSRDIVDRLSTDLGYCLFTAAVMFVFNARLPDGKIAVDARRRYGLCMQWLKKLADTWPAASAHRLLLDGFAVVGEDASKQGARVEGGRRGSAVRVGGGVAKVSSWIAETEASIGDAEAKKSGRGEGGKRGGNAEKGEGQDNGNGDVVEAALPMQGFADGVSLGFAGNQSNVGGMPSVDFAPGIFDVESFFWNENAASASNLMGTNFNSLPPNTVLPQQQQQGLPQQNMAYGFDLNNFSLGAGVAMQPNAQAMPYPSGDGYTQQPRLAQPQQQHARSNAMQQSNAAPPVPVSQNNTNAATAGGFNTSPFAFNPTTQNIGEFWSMLELPPAFLQQ